MNKITREALQAADKLAGGTYCDDEPETPAAPAGADMDLFGD